MLSNAVLNSYGLAGGNVWTGSNTGTLKSDDLVRAAALLRVTSDHFEEIQLNTYIAAQIIQHQNELLSGFTIPPDFIHAVGTQLQSYGILLSGTQINSIYPVDANARQQALLDVTTLGVRGVRNQLADSIDLEAKKLRLLEIATACGDLLDQLPSSLALRMQADAHQGRASRSLISSSSVCHITHDALNSIGLIFGLFAFAAFVGCVIISFGSCSVSAEALAATLGVDVGVLHYINGLHCE